MIQHSDIDYTVSNLPIEIEVLVNTEYDNIKSNSILSIK